MHLGHNQNQSQNLKPELDAISFTFDTDQLLLEILTLPAEAESFLITISSTELTSDITITDVSITTISLSSELAALQISGGMVYITAETFATGYVSSSVSDSFNVPSVE